MDPIDPKEIRYIKLGAGGKWVQVSLDRSEIHFSHRTVSMSGPATGSPTPPSRRGCSIGSWSARRNPTTRVMMKTELVVAGDCGRAKKIRPGIFPSGNQSVGATAEVDCGILNSAFVFRLAGA